MKSAALAFLANSASQSLVTISSALHYRECMVRRQGSSYLPRPSYVERCTRLEALEEIPDLIQEPAVLTLTPKLGDTLQIVHHPVRKWNGWRLGLFAFASSLTRTCQLRWRRPRAWIVFRIIDAQPYTPIRVRLLYLEVVFLAAGTDAAVIEAYTI